MKWEEVDRILKQMGRYDFLYRVEECIYRQCRREMTAKEDTYHNWKFLLESVANRFADNIENILKHPRNITPLDLVENDHLYRAAWAVAEIIREDRVKQFNNLKGTGISNESKSES